MKQEEFEAKREEFLVLLDQVASIPRPRYNYGTLSNATFAAIQFIRRLMEVQGFFMAHSRVTGKLPATKKDIGDILVKSMNLTRLSLAAIYVACSDGPLVSLLADLTIEELFIGAELERRLADKRFGTVVNLAPFFTGVPLSEIWLTKELKVDKVKAYRPWIQDEKDIKQDSLTRALELAASLESPAYDPGPLPPFPLELQPHEASFWNVGLVKAWTRGHETLRKGLIPVLQGDAESIPEQVRDDRREEWRKIVWRKALYDSHQDEIKIGVHPEPAEKTKAAPDVSARMFEVLKEAQRHKRWGQKAITALKYYLEGKTEEEASQLAKITPRTFQNYIARLRKSFASKK